MYFDQSPSVGPVDVPLDRIERNYRDLLAVAVVLNFQRETNSLWEAITAEITKVISWAWVSVTLYDHEADGFRFYVIATSSAGLVESELFGHERGTFSGADCACEGRFELAHGGSLFLDEISEMLLETQTKLLRVLQGGMVDRLGGRPPIRVDVQVIAATNSDLSVAVKEGTFRADLFYRLNVFPHVLPPLRDRPEDIPELARHFIKRYCVGFNRSCREIDQESLERLVRYPWPGKVRELENVTERTLILSHGPLLRVGEPILGFQGSTLAAGRFQRTRTQASSADPCAHRLAHRRFRWSSSSLGDFSQHLAQPDEPVWDKAAAFELKNLHLCLYRSIYTLSVPAPSIHREQPPSTNRDLSWDRCSPLQRISRLTSSRSRTSMSSTALRKQRQSGTAYAQGGHCTRDSTHPLRELGERISRKTHAMVALASHYPWLIPQLVTRDQTKGVNHEPDCRVCEASHAGTG